MRAVLVDQDAGGILDVECVAADVRATVDQQHTLVRARRQALGDDRAGEARPDDQVVERPPPAGGPDRGSARLHRQDPRAPGGDRLVDQAFHLRLGAVPGELRQDRVDVPQPGAPSAEGERALAGRDELLGRTRDGDPVQLAIVPADIDDRGRHHGLASGQVLGGLGGADEPRRLVDGEGHQGDVPPGEIGGKLVVGLGAQVVDVGPLWQVGRVDLHDRAHHHQAPVRPRSGQGVQELDVHPLVDHPIEAKTRMRGAGLVGGIRLGRAGLAEVLAVDAGRKGMDVGMAVALSLIEAVAAGEDEVRFGKKFAFQLHQLRRSEAEVREFVHAVVDGAGGRQMPGEGQHHRGVVPADDRAFPVSQQLIQQLAQLRSLFGLAQAFREHRGCDDDAVVRVDPDLQPRTGVAFQERLFPVDHQRAAGEAAHQVLGALEHEVPAKV